MAINARDNKTLSIQINDFINDLYSSKANIIRDNL